MCLMQAMQEQLPAAARVLTPAGHRWRSKMLTHFVEPAGDLCPSKFMKLYWGFEASLKCLRGIDSKRDCNSRFDPPAGAPVAVQIAAQFVEPRGISALRNS